MQIVKFLIYTCVLLCPIPAHAYIGPGLGLGSLGVILGIFTSIFLAIIGIFWYPLKRLVRKLRKNETKNK